MKHDKGIEELTNRYLELYKYAFSMLKNKADAEDVLQEAIATTLSYPYLRNPYGFCVRVLKRRCIDLLRKKGSLVILIEDMMKQDDSIDELKQQVMQMKDKLEDREKMLVEMHDIEGLSMREISEETGLGLSNIKKILNKVHKKMRKQLL